MNKNHSSFDIRNQKLKRRNQAGLVLADLDTDNELRVGEHFLDFLLVLGLPFFFVFPDALDDGGPGVALNLAHNLRVPHLILPLHHYFAVPPPPIAILVTVLDIGADNLLDAAEVGALGVARERDQAVRRRPLDVGLHAINGRLQLPRPLFLKCAVHYLELESSQGAVVVLHVEEEAYAQGEQLVECQIINVLPLRKFSYFNLIFVGFENFGAFYRNILYQLLGLVQALEKLLHFFSICIDHFLRAARVADGVCVHFF